MISKGWYISIIKAILLNGYRKYYDSIWNKDSQWAADCSIG